MAGEPQKAQVVIIEDNLADVLLIRKALDQNGLSYVMTRFEDGQKALNALCPETGETEIKADVIVLDLNLPCVEGIDVLRRIRQTPALAELPVVVLTSSESPSDRQRTEQFGANRYILKPAQLDEFLTQVGAGITDLLPKKSAKMLEKRE
jgi:CheY-like chemotaxis protein